MAVQALGVLQAVHSGNLRSQLLSPLALGGGTFQAQPAEFSSNASQGGQQDIRSKPASSIRVLQYQWGAACSDAAHAQTSGSTGTVTQWSLIFFFWPYVSKIRHMVLIQGNVLPKCVSSAKYVFHAIIPNMLTDGNAMMTVSLPQFSLFGQAELIL